jgi:hypothetical protein
MPVYVSKRRASQASFKGEEVTWNTVPLNCYWHSLRMIILHYAEQGAWELQPCVNIWSRKRYQLQGPCQAHNACEESDRIGVPTIIRHTVRGETRTSIYLSAPCWSQSQLASPYAKHRRPLVSIWFERAGLLSWAGIIFWWERLSYDVVSDWLYNTGWYHRVSYAS